MTFATHLHPLCLNISVVSVVTYSPPFFFFFLLFVDVMEDLYNYVNPLNKRHSPMISKETLDIISENKAVRHVLTIHLSHILHVCVFVPMFCI